MRSLGAEGANLREISRRHGRRAAPGAILGGVQVRGAEALERVWLVVVVIVVSGEECRVGLDGGDGEGKARADG